MLNSPGTNSTKRMRMKKQWKNKAKGYQYGKIKLQTSQYLENRLPIS
jgi:hypothetical protein